jgi:DNA polymerase-3 subunit alpha
LVRGLGVRLQLLRAVDEPVDGCSGAEAVLALGEDARFYPTDAALASWRAQADQGRAVIAYE